jgi:hypothetical protein
MEHIIRLPLSDMKYSIHTLRISGKDFSPASLTDMLSHYFARGGGFIAFALEKI